MKAIEITGVWVMRRGGEGDPNAKVEVYVELPDGWHHVITEALESNFSHAVSSDGIRNSPLADWININDEVPATCSRGAKIGETLGIVP